MSQAQVISFQKAMDIVELLPAEDQETLVELIRHRLLERRRATIARNVKETVKAVREGRAQVGSVEDLRRDLLSA